MNKITITLLWAALALPVMALNANNGNLKSAATKSESQRDMTSRDVVFKSNPIPSNDWLVRRAPARAEGKTLYSWDFETDESFEGWGVFDADGDGNVWGYMSDESTAHSGANFMVSESYISGSGGGALDPDNWLISPDVQLSGTLSIWAMNYSSYFPDKISIYVCVGSPTSIDDFVVVAPDITPPSSWTEYTVDLSEYAGDVGCFAIRHHDSYDNFRIYIDDISITGPGVSAPESLTVEPADVTADVAWVDGENTTWNLRYREIVPGVENNLLWDFEEATGTDNTELTAGWTCIDADGDGNEWYHLQGVAGLKAHSGSGHVTSASYNGSALNPDNWLVSPLVKLDGKLSFWACGQDPSYAGEVFRVYASTDTTDMANWQPLSEDITATGVMTEYTFDLSAYQGVDGYVAIRHYNVYDMFRLNVDDIAITYVEEAEWTYVNGLDATNYTRG